MSKETERLFKPGEYYIIMPDRSIYIFNDDDPENPPELEYKAFYQHPIELYADPCLYHQPPVFDRFIVSLFHAKPGCFVKCDSVEIFSKSRNKISTFLSQEKQTP
jgi:hypothetical protein